MLPCFFAAFFRLEDLNRAIRELLEKLNHRGFKKT
jgi:hypothetical protein